jgi:GNAT superfamily N-acetyltransferase
MARIDPLSEIKIRVAVPRDSESIARVHIQAWQEAYAGLIPEGYLNQLSSQLENRVAMWKHALENRERWTWVAEDIQGIVGLVSFGPPRDQHREGFIELGALYLLASAQKKKAGFALVSAGFRGMRALGYSKAYCWVLENNPTAKFYEKTGARLSSQVKQDKIGGKTFNELAYEWDNIEAIANAFRE